MRKILNGRLFATAAALFLASISGHAQIDIFNDTFDPYSVREWPQLWWAFGDTTSASSTMVPGVGVNATTGWQTVNTAASGTAGFSGVAGWYAVLSASGNTSSNLSDYVLSFDAKSTGGSLSIMYQTWELPMYSGQVGTLWTTTDLTLTPDFRHYSINLSQMRGDLTPSGAMGGTIQLAMQLNGSGPTPYSYTMVVDNFTLTMIPEPSALALTAFGLAGVVLSSRCRRL